MKNDKTNLIIWATVALVIGIVVGAFLIGPMTTTGNAKAVMIDNAVVAEYIEQNDIKVDCCKFGRGTCCDQISALVDCCAPPHFNKGCCDLLIELPR